jgi:starch synthase
MNKKRILIIAQEMQPYLELSSMAKLIRYLAPYLQRNNLEVRLFMPKFGTINEKRHRLHEVVRLSGMNIVVDNDDYPLIIKVATLQDAKMQVYFLDNEELFNRKFIFTDENNQAYNDNDVRMSFFCKGVMETVKKLGWKPDIIHCHGWMTSLIPMYIKTAYASEPICNEAKVVYSLYENAFHEKWDGDFKAKAQIFDEIEDEHLKHFEGGDFVSLNKGGIAFSDAVVVGNENFDPSLKEVISKISDKPVLDYKDENEYMEASLNFYQPLLAD